MKNNLPHNQEDIFMKRFKYYKSNKPQPSFDQIIKSECDGTSVVDMMQVTTDIKEFARVRILGLQDSRNWKIFVLANHPGLFLIKNPFTSLGQRFWIRKCLQAYPKKPNKTNIDVENHIEDWWMECYKDGKCDKKMQKKLRWTTLGYHHNWDTKVYSEENKNDFPKELAELCDVIAQHLGYGDFRAEAAIVNYYHMGSTLSAHTDHSEVNLEAPLFSFSFGQSAIFLIGGHNKSIEPSAILLTSGDIVVMSKEARLCYHAVPKILLASSQPWNNHDNLTEIEEKEGNFKFVDEAQLLLEMRENIDDKSWRELNSYIEESRININVRQVLKQNQKSLYDYNNT